VKKIHNIMKIKKFKEYIDIPNEIKELSDIFKKNNKKLYVVGGYIRDKIMGLNPLDIDLSTDSLPDETISFLKGKYKLDYVGKAFGVIIVDIGSMKVEIASFRKDITIGRHPEIKLGVTIEDDVKRRDLTISAIFYDIQKDEIVDLVGGVDDINHKIIRMVGSPKDRLEEDQLRSMRVIRFACRYGFTIESNTVESLKKYTDLSKISKERIFEEIYKSYKQCGDRFVNYLKYFNDLDLFKQIFPNIILNKEIVKCDSFEVYLANLFKNNKVTNFTQFNDGLIQKYLIPNDISRVITFLISFQHFSTDKLSEFYSKKKSYKINNNIIENWINVAHLDSIEYTAFLKYTPITSSDELMKQGFIGKALGDEIKRLEIINFNNLLND
jgi:tRNA nucleotidyltransferase/poly(A) polymerase